MVPGGSFATAAVGAQVGGKAGGASGQGMS